MIFHAKSANEILKEFKVQPDVGLSTAEATERLGKYGPNRLKEGKKKTMFQRFLAQFKDVMILILLAAALVSFAVACMEKHAAAFFEPLLIVLIVTINAIMGVMQESKAEKAMEALKNLSSPHAKVIRDGHKTVIEAADLVPGDIIFLEAGDFVPADARLIEASGLKIEEAALTGESVPSEKDAAFVAEEATPLGDRINMVYSGCSVTYGSGTAVVVYTGMDTEMGRIANLLEEEGDTQTPLQKKLASMGKYLGAAALAACGVIFIVGLLDGMNVLDIFMTSVSLAVSAIPEGLPAIVTIVLSIGTQRMAKRNAIIRRLPAVETLGNASVICSDKTGTLTQNRMTLVEVYTDSGADEKVTAENSPEVRKLMTYAALCCDSAIVVDGKDVQHVGDPTETAILYGAWRNGIDYTELNKAHERLATLPFDSDRKLMTTVNRMEDGTYIIVKGAFDVLAARCIAGDIDKARAICDRMAENALRVIAVAVRKVDALPAEIAPETLEKDLTFMGLVAMIDPPRPEAKEAVALCRKAGIKPVMITGDHIITASAIARELGILTDGDEAITGAELDLMNDRELDSRVANIAVYARVSPENKIRIVRAWQRKEQVVSMTGDGVNDAPALKAADIGCAMGITGTDVAKGAADMTLSDDNFATIVDAVREGRGIYDNIKKVVGFLLGTNIGEVFTVFFAMLLWRETPLISIQLLWINLVTDSLPAIALGMEPVEKDVMDRPPKPKNEGIFAHGMFLRILLQGAMFAILTLTAYQYGKGIAGIEGGETMAFMVLAMSQVVQAFNMRSEHSLFKIGFFGNKKLNGAALISTVLTMAVLLTPVVNLFGMVYLPLKAYLVGLVLILVPLVVMEAAKAVGLIRPRG